MLRFTAACPLTQPESLFIFTASCWEDHLLPALVLQAGTPCCSRGTSAAGISLLVLNCHRRCGPCPFWVIILPSSLGFSLVAWVTGLLSSKSPGASQLWWFYNLIVTSMWLWEEASTTFTYSVFLTRMLCYTCFITYLLADSLLTHANINYLCVVLQKYLTGLSVPIFLKNQHCTNCWRWRWIQQSLSIFVIKK